MFDALKEFETELVRCLRCAECHAGCPIYLDEKNESYSARAKFRLMRAVMDGELELDDDVIQRIDMCLNCNACMSRCPAGIDTDMMILKARHELRQAGVPLPENVEGVRRNIAEKKNPFGLPHAERGDWVTKDVVERQSPLCYFAGCAVSYSQNKMAKAALRVLDTAGIEYTALGGDERCCGDPVERMGLFVEAEQLREENRGALRDKGVKTVFTSCAGCTKALKHHLGDEFEVLHVTELLDRLAADGQIEFEKPFEKKVMFFDGCDLGRHAGVYDPPRNLLKRLPGLTAVELGRNREKAMCCGGPFVASHPEKARQFAADRIAEAKAAGADVIAVACPTCLVNLKEGAKGVESAPDIQDISIILQRSARKPAAARA
jgi:heterodisulfide reductase subunit D